MKGHGRRLLVAAAAVIAAAVSMADPAAGGTITFTGYVTENSCTVQVNGAGAGDGTIALPVVDTTALAAALMRKDTTAGTYFNITVSNCVLDRADASGNPPTRVSAYFEAGPTVDPVTHALVNTGTSNVEVKLYEASGTAVVGTQVSPGTSNGREVAGAGLLHYYAAYSLAAGIEARAGTVSTSVTYSLIYF